MIDGKVNIRDREQVWNTISKKSRAFTTAYTPLLKQCAGEFKPTGKGTKPGSMSEALPVLQALRLFGDGRVDECENDISSACFRQK